MTNKERDAIHYASKRIESLASLENANFSEAQKKTMKPYMMWFEVVSMFLDEMVEGDKAGNKQLKTEAMQRLVRMGL